MIDLSDIHSLSDFQRNTKAHLRRMRKTGRPVVLTVNGKAQMVVHDSASYQRLLDEIDRADAIEAVQEGLASMARGEGRPAQEVLEQIRRKYRIRREA